MSGNKGELVQNVVLIHHRKYVLDEEYQKNQMNKIIWINIKFGMEMFHKCGHIKVRFKSFFPLMFGANQGGKYTLMVKYALLRPFFNPPE